MRLLAVALLGSTLLWPLEGYRSLAGNFGEYRPGHPHAGVDISTFGRTGLPVRCAVDASVFKIRKSRYGYGNVVYLRTDDGGYVVYAHLERFCDRLEALFEGRPADREGRVEVVPPAGSVRVGRGEVIAFTGESGAGLPHLHFEVRDAAERPLNPLTHGADLPDREWPIIHALVFEPAGPEGRIEGRPGPVEVSGPRRLPLRVRPPFRVLAVASDGDGRGRGRLGVYKVRLLLDGVPVHEVVADRFSYDRQAEIGLVVDPYRTRYGRFVYRLYDAGGSGEMVAASSGPALAPPAGRAVLAVEAEDEAGHVSRYAVEIEILGPNDRDPPPGAPGVHPMDRWIGVVRPGGGVEAVDLASLPEGRREVETGRGRFVFGLGRADPRSGGGVETPDGRAALRVPPGAAYATACLVAAAETLPGRADLPLVRGPYAFYPLGLPFDGKARVSFRAPPIERLEQVGVYRYDAPRRRWLFEDDERRDGRIEADVRFLAPFALLRDAIPPRVTGTWPRDGARVPRADRLTVTIEDDGSGVDPEGVHATIGGRRLEGWYDPDRNHFIHEGTLAPGRYRVEVTARDRAENRVRHTFSFEVAP